MKAFIAIVLVVLLACGCGATSVNTGEEGVKLPYYSFKTLKDPIHGCEYVVYEYVANGVAIYPRMAKQDGKIEQVGCN